MNEKEYPFIEEEWKPITEKSVPGIIPNKYLISNMGRVYNTKRNIYQKIVPSDYKLQNPYYRVSLETQDGRTRYYLIHRILMIEFNCIDLYKDMQVNHKDGIKLHNFISNLEWCTCSENIQHAFDKGLKSQYRGEDCSWSTITNEQAEKIAQLLTEQKYTHQQIADIIGCSKSVVADIQQGQNWKYLYKKYNLERYKKKLYWRFTDDQLHMIFKYFQDNKNKYSKLSDLYRHALKDLFNIEYTTSASATMSRLYNRQTRTDISKLYDF